MANGWGSGSRCGQLWIRCRDGIDPLAVSKAIDAHQRNDANGRAFCDQWSERASTSRVGGWAVKWNKWRGVRGMLSDAVYGSRAARARLGATRLARTAVAGVEPLAIVEHRKFGFVSESFAVLRYLEGAQPLPVLAPVLQWDRERRLALIERLGDAIGALHAAGLHHADLKHSNLLVATGDRVVLADLESLVPRRRLNRRRRVRALGQLNAYSLDLYPWLTRADRARFLRAYLHRQPEFAADRRVLTGDVQLSAERTLVAWSSRKRADRDAYPLVPREHTQRAQPR